MSAINITVELDDDTIARIAAAVAEKIGVGSAPAVTADDKPAPKSQPKPAPVEDVEDEDTDVDITKLSIAELRKLALEEGYAPEDVKGATKAELLEALSGEDEDEGDEEEDLDDEAEEEAEDEDEGDEEDDEFSEDDLKELSVRELREYAKEYGIKVKAGLSKDDIIEVILEAFEEDEDEE